MKSHSIQIPSIESCYRIMVDMAMMEHIAAHSIQVYLVALKLTDLFLCRGTRLNRDLIGAAALLHDITKTQSLGTGENHAATGSALVYSLGYPEVSRIVAQHVRLKEWKPTALLREEEVVNYADKRVIHDRIGSLEERESYILERYGTDETSRKNIREMFRESGLIEKRLFKDLHVNPQDLVNLVVPVCQAPEFEAYRHYAAVHHKKTAQPAKSVK